MGYYTSYKFLFIFIKTKKKSIKENNKKKIAQLAIAFL